MIRFVNAKINLGLNIVSKRNDGYHNLETIFYPVGIDCGTTTNSDSQLCDILEITPSNAEKSSFETIGNDIDCPIDKNIVFKAINLFNSELKKKGVVEKPLSVTLEKHLPSGAGMGGGSADASFALMMLNDFYNGLFSKKDISTMALKLGADCPFFINNKPCYADGIGEKLENIDLNLNGWWIAIVKPEVSISTKEAFQNIVPQTPAHNLKESIRQPIEQWQNLIVNDFEKSMFYLHPEIKEIKEILISNGAVYASMTGSGSAFFGLFKCKKNALEAVDKTNCQFKTVIQL